MFISESKCLLGSFKALCAPCASLYQLRTPDLKTRVTQLELKGTALRGYYQDTLVKKELGNSKSSSNSKAVSVGIPLICAVFVVVIVLLLMKSCYLKQRRIQTIHQIPTLLATLHDDELESRGTGGGCHSIRVADTLNTVDAVSVGSRAPSKRASALSSISENSRQVRHYPDPAPGLLVGLLGSPDWETGMQRQIADHHWRQRRASREVTGSWQLRHTWHSQQSTSQPPYSMSRAHTYSTNTGSQTRRHSGRAASSRIPHVSSFGEIGVAQGSRRPKSFNAVLEHISTSHSFPAFGRPPLSNIGHQEIGDSNDGAGGSGTLTASINTHSLRPSTINEVDTPTSTHSQTKYGTAGANLRIHVTDYGGSSNVSPVLTPLSESSTGVLRESDTTDMEVSSSYGRLDTSAGSSIVSSWGQLPNFPSPPVTPVSPVPVTPNTSNIVSVNTVLVGPSATHAQLYGRIFSAEASYSTLSGNSGYNPGLAKKAECGFSMKCQLRKGPPTDDTTLSFGSGGSGWPVFQDTLPSNLMELTHPSSDTINSTSARHHAHPNGSIAEIKGSTNINANARRRMPFSPLSNLLKRRLSRVRVHSPAALAVPPEVYPRSSGPIGDGRSPFNQNAKHILSQSAELSTGHVLFAPVKPSPLREVALANSMTSRTSMAKKENMPGSIKPTEPSVKNVDGDVKDTRDRCNSDDVGNGSDILPGASGLARKDSRPSLFLDFNSSEDLCNEEISEFFSLETSESAEDEKRFEHPQASMSGILDVEIGPCN